MFLFLGVLFSSLCFVLILPAFLCCVFSVVPSRNVLLLIIIIVIAFYTTTLFSDLHS
jgi:hypothetical protein